MKKWIKKVVNFIIERGLKLWRLIFYIGGMMGLILEAVGTLHDGLGLLIFLDCMVIILLPRINDEVFKPLLEEDDKEI